MRSRLALAAPVAALADTATESAHAGQFRKPRSDREYHGYRFHCHSGRLSRSSRGCDGRACE